MRITYDPQADAMYIEFNENKVSKTEEVSNDIILDFDENNNVRGIEMLFVSDKFPLENLSRLDIQIPIKAEK